MRLAIDDAGRGEWESAMLHACNAVDGTAAKASPGAGVGKRFVGLLQENADILGRLGLPGIDAERTEFPVRLGTEFQMRDLASVVYGIHRCTHGHGDELPDGFALLPAESPGRVVARIDIESGALQLPTVIIYGLLAVAVLHPVNQGQPIPMAYHLTSNLVSLDGRNDTLMMPIHQWWGRAADYREIARAFPPALTRLDFSDALAALEARQAKDPE